MKMGIRNFRPLNIAKRSDLGFIFLVTIVLLGLTAIPYLYGYISTPEGSVYTGLAGRDVPGTYMYFMWEVQSRDGYHLFQDRFTPENHERFYFNAEWWLLGKLLRYSGLPVIAGFHVERCFTSFFAVLFLYYFLTCFFERRFERRCVLLLILFATGLGWLFWLIGQWTGSPIGIKIWDIEGINLFGSLINKPHFVRSIAFVCLGYAFLLKGEEKDKTLYFFLAGLCVVIHGIIRPYNLPIAFLLFSLVPAVIFIKEGRISRRKVKNYSVLILTSLPIVAYYLHLRYFSIFKDVWRGVELSPLSPLEFAVWLGVPFFIALVGFDGFRDLRNRNIPDIFLNLWALCLLAMIYSYPFIPWGMEGAGTCYILAPILAGKTIFQKWTPGLKDTKADKKRRVRLEMFLIAIVMILSLPSGGILFSNMITELSKHSRPYYLSQNLDNAFSWLKHNADDEDIVLCGAPNGYYLPTRANVRAFTAHYNFTIDFEEKNNLVWRFFSKEEKNDFRRKLLQEFDVDYVLYSSVERHIGAMDPKSLPFLKVVYQSGNVVVFEVSREIKGLYSDLLFHLSYEV